MTRKLSSLSSIHHASNNQGLHDQAPAGDTSLDHCQHHAHEPQHSYHPSQKPPGCHQRPHNPPEQWTSLLTYSPSSTLKSHSIPAATGFAFTPRANTNFRIVDLHGQQVVDFMAWSLASNITTTSSSSSPSTAPSTLPTSEHFSASYTRYNINGSAPPVVGECLYSNLGRKMFEIVADQVKCHDMLFMACNPSFYKNKGAEGHRNCAENVAGAVNLWWKERSSKGTTSKDDCDLMLHAQDEEKGRVQQQHQQQQQQTSDEGRSNKDGAFQWHHVHDPFNIFQNTPYYTLKALESSRAGDYIELKALGDSVVALSCCPYDDDGFNGGKVTDVGVVWEE